jgi:hypothetical protein
MIDKNILAGFGGSEQWHKWSPLFPNVTLTDGAKYIADNGGQSGAYWLMDAIASQIEEAKKANEMCADFQSWELKVNLQEHTAVLTCIPDTGMDPVVTQNFEYTDFDLPELKLWVEPGGPEDTMVILLPDEH